MEGAFFNGNIHIRVTPEEQQKINEENDRYRAELRGYSSQAQQTAAANETGGESEYYSGQMPQVEQSQQTITQPAVTDTTVVERQPSQLWLADPVNFTQIEDAYKDPNYQDEHWTREQIEALDLPCFGKTRGLGLMIGIEVKDGYTNREIAARLIDNGLLVLTAGPAIRLLPPLTVTKEEMDAGVTIMKRTLQGG